MQWLNGPDNTRLLMYCGHTLAKIVKSGQFRDVYYLGDNSKVRFTTKESNGAGFEKNVRSAVIVLMAEAVANSAGSSQCIDRRN